MTEKELNELGGSCITPKVHKRRETDYDGYNDYHEIIIERQHDTTRTY